MYVIAQEHHDGYLLLTTGDGVLVFGSRFEAEDYSDTLDEEGEFVAIPYDPSMGSMVFIV